MNSGLDDHTIVAVYSLNLELVKAKGESSMDNLEKLLPRRRNKALKLNLPI
jgi:hypothetical protein